MTIEVLKVVQCLFVNVYSRHHTFITLKIKSFRFCSYYLRTNLKQYKIILPNKKISTVMERCLQKAFVFTNMYTELSLKTMILYVIA